MDGDGFDTGQGTGEGRFFYNRKICAIGMEYLQKFVYFCIIDTIIGSMLQYNEHESSVSCGSSPSKDSRPATLRPGLRGPGEYEIIFVQKGGVRSQASFTQL